jgi:DNA-binding SARP family transcriptional activator/predicted ATPase
MLVLDLLGPTRATYNGVPLSELPVGKNLALLAYLVLEQRPHARERLAALLWSDMPAARAQSNLRMALYTLNNLLPEVLASNRSTVALAADLPLQVDLLQLSAVAVDPAATIADLDAALALWRGELLPDLALSGAALFDEWLGPTRERARLNFFTVLERFSEACVRRGEPLRAVGALQLWLQIEPWSETAHRALMLALARAGRYTEALAQYEACCTALQHELNVPPMPETSRLAEHIQFARSLERRDNLPPELTPLVGRADELIDLQQLVLNPTSRFVSVCGLGGMGKTRLALHAAATLKYAFLHGAWFVALENCTDPLGIAATVAAALDLPLTAGTPPEAAVLKALKERELLLVLDGFEELVAGAALLNDWLSAAPGLRLLVTSRRRLALRGETVFGLEGLDHAAAAELFCACVRRINPACEPATTPDALEELCRLTGGMPLALELAAAWTEQYTVPAIAAQIAHDSEALSGAYRDLPANQRSLRAIVAFSWRLLPAAAQNALARLAVLRGRFDAEQALAVGGANADMLTMLVHSALVQQPAEASFTMHEIVRQFALQQLQAEPAAEAEARRAHLVLFGELLQTQNTLLSGGETTGQALQHLATGFENIRVAWEHACVLQEAAWLDAAAEPVHKFCEGQGRYAEGEALFQRALAATDAAPTRSRLHIHHAALLLRLGRVPAALAAAEAALPDLPDEMVGFAGNLLGILYAASGNNDAALAAYEQSLAIYRRNGETRQMVKPLANMGSLLLRLERVDAALETLSQGLELARALGDQRGQAHFLNNLGLAYFQQERYTTAGEYFQACADLCRELDNDSVRLVAVYNLAEIALIRREITKAQHLAGTAAALAAQFGDRRNQALALRILGMAELHLAGADAGAPYLEQALALAHATQSPPIMLDAVYGWAHLLLVRGDTTRAAELLALVRSHPATERYLLRQAENATAGMAIPPLTPQEALERLPLVEGRAPGRA